MEGSVGMEGWRMRWARNWCYAQTVGAQRSLGSGRGGAELLVSDENTMGSRSPGSN